MNELTELLAELAIELGTTTEYLWSILLKQAPIEAATGIVLFALSLIAIVAFYRYARWISSHAALLEKSDRLQMHVMIVILIGLLLGVWLAARLDSIPNIVSAIFNPEYWALRQILELV